MDPAPRFIGRTAELQRLAALDRRWPRLVSVVGPAGIGKTRLAREHAARRAGRRLLFCDLSEARTVEDVLAAVARMAGAPLRPDLSFERNVRGVGLALAAAGDAGLVVLDGFEPVIDHAAGTIAAWLLAAPAVRFLVTSREPLRVYGESVLLLGPLSATDAEALFLARTGGMGARAVGGIVRALGGIPLAIELAAGLVPALDPRELVDRLCRPRVSGIVRTAVDCSWELLSPWERDVLSQLSIFRGGFTLEATLSVVAARKAVPALVDVLGMLCRRALVRTTDPVHPSGERRFELQRAVRDYAEEKLFARGDPDAVAARHAAHYLRLARSHARNAAAGDRDAALRWLAAETENLVLVHRAALAAGHRGAEQVERALLACLALEMLWQHEGLVDLPMSFLDAALAAAAHVRAEPVLLAGAHLARSRFRRHRLEIAGALHDADRARELARHSRAGRRGERDVTPDRFRGHPPVPVGRIAL